MILKTKDKIYKNISFIPSSDGCIIKTNEPIIIGDTLEILSDEQIQLCTYTISQWLRCEIDENILILSNTPIPEPQPIDIEKLKKEKISSLSMACEQTIYNGLDLELSEGKEHFEYKNQDQTNIKAMFDAVVFGAEKYPYQSEDGNCRVYTAQDIITLYTSLEGLRTAQLTYYHQLKDLVNTLETAEEINAVTYGQPLEGEYLQHYNEMLAVAQEQMQLVLSKVVQNVV